MLTVRASIFRCISLYSYIKPQLISIAVSNGIAVYPYIPTSNRNVLRLQRYNVLLYILIFLHQTATAILHLYSRKGCISLYSYIKPQPKWSAGAADGAVYPYIPTSNRNCYRLTVMRYGLYILIFLHQTATCPTHTQWPPMLYILIFLHQTATRTKA